MTPLHHSDDVSYGSRQTFRGLRGLETRWSVGVDQLSDHGSVRNVTLNIWTLRLAFSTCFEGVFAPRPSVGPSGVGCVDFSDFGPSGFLPQALFFTRFEDTPHQHFNVRSAVIIVPQILQNVF